MTETDTEIIKRSEEGFKDAVKYEDAFRGLRNAIFLAKKSFVLLDDTEGGNQDYIEDTEEKYVKKSFELEQRVLNDIEEIRKKYGADFIDSIFGKESPYCYAYLTDSIKEFNKAHCDLSEAVACSKVKYGIPFV